MWHSYLHYHYLTWNSRFFAKVKERPDVGVYVKDLSTFVVNNADDMDHIMTLGNKNRKSDLCAMTILTSLLNVKTEISFSVILGFAGIVGYTSMNEQSSRSHAIFTITIECSYAGVDGQPRVRAGKLHMVDLAVSLSSTECSACHPPH